MTSPAGGRDGAARHADPAAAPCGGGDVSSSESGERMCRYCFGEEGDLISPCVCKGGQKWVHLECLRRWQRMVLVSQPTHPRYWEDDQRHRVCNVCKTEYTCPPPSREELMRGFTGPEIAALIEEGRLIGTHEGFNRQIEAMLEANPIVAMISGQVHWYKGVYLITQVREEDGVIELRLRRKEELALLREQLGDDATLEAEGTRYRVELGAAAPLLDMPAFDAAAGALIFPCKITLRAVAPSSSSDDKIAAVNLTRPFQPPPGVMRELARTILACKASAVDVTFYRGGPCDDDEVTTCVVLGGHPRGYVMVHDDFERALLLAKEHAAAAQKPGCNGIAVGQEVVVKACPQHPEAVGKRGLVTVLHEDAAAPQFEVRLFAAETHTADGDHEDASTTVTLPSDALEAYDSNVGRTGTVYAFIGDARWSRAQLLGEIAKASWGLCRARLQDLVLPAADRYEAVFPRLVYAPESEMSEEHARNTMNMLRRNAQEAAHYASDSNSGSDSEADGDGGGAAPNAPAPGAGDDDGAAPDAAMHGSDNE
eukprot:TRINITY_DN15721_c0_g1_i1.p1 TRINITY_DN15721_c0_g1~~TRINITY_DN15721_c0_g1_i1.p1  ORF type:complete len:540 (+),score=181.56 TRINITY_DN15721_c0_g1_i1:70-1689(+)